MTATRIDGKATAAQIRAEVKEEVARLLQAGNPAPGLAVILVGEDRASQVYVRNKGRACEEVGIYSMIKRVADTISEAELLAEIDAINKDGRFHGLLVQLPLPGHITEQHIIEAVAPQKDVDCFHPFNVGKLVLGVPIFQPATPAGIVELLKRYEIDTVGKHVVIIGRSNIVGKPLANLMVQKQAHANAVVTVVHSAAKDLREFTRSADILVAAIGRAEYVTRDMVKPGAVVVDVGINSLPADTPKGYRLVGDVAFAEVSEVASFITPVPGGVGPMTIAMLLRNTLAGYYHQTGIRI